MSCTNFLSSITWTKIIISKEHRQKECPFWAHLFPPSSSRIPSLHSSTSFQESSLIPSSSLSSTSDTLQSATSVHACCTSYLYYGKELLRGHYASTSWVSNSFYKWTNVANSPKVKQVGSYCTTVSFRTMTPRSTSNSRSNRSKSLERLFSMPIPRLNSDFLNQNLLPGWCLCAIKFESNTRKIPNSTGPYVRLCLI